MRNNKIIKSFLIVLLIVSCGSNGNGANNKSHKGVLTRFVLRSLQITLPLFLSKEQKLAKQLYHAVYRAVSGYDIYMVKETLEAGADPDYCIGECGWQESNPLNVVSQSFYGTYFRKKIGEVIPDPAPDVETLNILLNAGADINRRPYVWNRVYESLCVNIVEP